MALWPFGRHKKRARKGDDETDAVPPADQPLNHRQQLATTTPSTGPPPARPHTPPAQTAATDGHGHGLSASKLVRRDSKRQKYGPALQPGRHAVAASASSFSPFHRSSPVAATTAADAATITTTTTTTTATPAGPSSTFSSPQTLPDGRTLRQPTSVDTFASVNALSPSKLRAAPRTMMSQQGEGEAYLVPTLHGKRNASEPGILRRRSDRRRRNDTEREQQIKRMGSLVWDPKKNRAEASRASDRHLSDPFTTTSYSAPLAPEQGESSSYTFKLSALNALSPRPFLRYGDGNRGSLPSTTQISRSSTKDKSTPRWFSADQSAASRNKKIEDLADSMDAGALRQLMDRDRRRRLVKRQILREQQQALASASASRQRPPPPAQAEVKAPPPVPVPVEHEPEQEKPTANLADQLPSSPDQMDVSKSPEQPESWLRDTSSESLVKEEEPIDPITELKEEEEDISPTAFPVPPSTLVSRNGQTLELAIPPNEHRDEIPDIRQHPAFRQPSVSEASTKPSTTQNETKLGRTWTQLFRRRGTLRRKANVFPRNSSSEFSVTSRGSGSRINQPYHPAAPIAIATTASSHRVGTDTQSITSKFTEHLDDGTASLAPQGSRVYSPEPYSNPRDDAYSGSQRMSGGAEMYSISGMSTGAYVPGPDTRPNSTFLAQSLASIDSEGSWLSGRPSRRLSQAPLKSPGSTRERLDDTIDPEAQPDDDNAVSSDEYFGTLPVPKEEEEEDADARVNPLITTTTNGHRDLIIDDGEISPLVEDGMELANADGDPPTWHSSVGKRARLISPETRAKSREGLFTEFIESENEVSPIEETEPEIRRAQSIDLGRHIRHISAGSAKLVTLCRAESKRYSATSLGSSGIFPTKVEDEI